MTDVSKSEGEFLYKTPLPPEKDPVLDLLARLQSSSPQYGIHQMSSKQVGEHELMQQLKISISLTIRKHLKVIDGIANIVDLKFCFWRPFYWT